MRIFHVDSPIMRIMNRVANIMIVNMLLLFCSVPIVTAGAATVAAHKVMQGIVRGTESGILKEYFRAFTLNLKQATIAWIVFISITLALVYEMYILLVVHQITSFSILIIGVLIVSVLLIGISSYLFPLIARYENTLIQHLKNAFYLLLGNPLRSMLLITVGIAPFVVPLVSTDFFIRRIYIWILFFLGLSVYLNAILLKPVFQKLENGMSCRILR